MKLWQPKVAKGWEIFLPPPTLKKRKWLSLNDRNHWSRSSPLTRYWRELACGVAGGMQIPRLDQAWVMAVFSFGDNRRRDVHNYMPTVKAAVDGLTDAHVWEDDRDGILIGPDLRRVEVPKCIGLTLHIYQVVPNV